MSYQKMLHITEEDQKILSHFYDYGISYARKVLQDYTMSPNTIVKRMRYLTQQGLLRGCRKGNCNTHRTKYYSITGKGISLVEFLMELNK